MNPELLRYSLRLGFAAALTAAIAVWCERITYVWYPLLAVVMTIDDSDDQTFKAAWARLLGTILGGLVTFLVHTLLAGWIGVLVSLLLMLPLLRMLGWQAAIGSATLVSLMFLMIPSHAELNWTYVFNRGLDTSVGCLIAILAGLLFWPQSAQERLETEQRALLRRLRQQIDRYHAWLAAGGARPAPLAAAPFTASVQRLESLVAMEQRGPRRPALLRRHWPERVGLWQAIEHHWISFERLLATLPDGLPAPASTGASPLNRAIRTLAPPLAEAAPPAPMRAAAADAPEGSPPEPLDWQQLAQASGLPLMLLLAIGCEQRQLHEGLQALQRLDRC